MKKEITPEGKLLQLIRAKKGLDKEVSKENKATLDFQKPISGPTSRPTYQADRKPIQTPGVYIRPRPVPVNRPASSNLFKALIFVLIGVVVYFIADFFFIAPYQRKKINEINLGATGMEIQSEKEVALPEKPEAQPIKPYSYYSKDITSRNIFKPLVQQEAKLLEEGLKNVRENFNLIGIIAGAKLQAAIEDKKTQKTYFVSQGEYIGDVLVEEIFENKAILSYKGETFELML